MSLPCAKNCARFCEGCHKSCKSWAIRQRAAVGQRERIKKYLRETRDLQTVLERQLARPAGHFFR